MKIITISGKAEAGKDLCANILKEHLEQLGHDVLISHYGDLVKFVCEKYFGWNSKKDEQGRKLLQYVGTDVIRFENPDYWVNFVKDILSFFPDEFEYVLISDCRFPNEVEIFKEDGFNVISLHVEKIGHENILTPEQRLHASETALDNYKFDYYIKSKSGTKNLEKEVKKFLQEII